MTTEPDFVGTRPRKEREEKENGFRKRSIERSGRVPGKPGPEEKLRTTETVFFMGRLKRPKLRLRRYVVLGVIAIGLRARLRHRVITTLSPRPIAGIVIGAVGGVFIDRGLRESSITDNLLMASIFAGLFGIYDQLNGITIRLRDHGYGDRLLITLIFLGLIGIVSALFNELISGRPSKLSPIAVIGAVIAMVLFTSSIQTVQVVEKPIAVYDVGKMRTKFVFYNTTTGDDVSSSIVATQVIGANGTVLGTAYVTEDTGLEAYVPYTYITIWDNDTGLKGGTYHFKILISGQDDGVVHNDYYGNRTIQIIASVLDNSLYMVLRRAEIYNGPVQNNGTIVVDFNRTLPYDVASMVNGDPDNRLRLEINFEDAKTAAKRDKISVTVIYELIETTYPNINYINYAVASLALAVLAAVPEIPVGVKKRRARARR